MIESLIKCVYEYYDSALAQCHYGNMEFEFIVTRYHRYNDFLEDFEVEIFNKRFKDKKSLVQISAELGYKSHSSVSKIITSALKKLEKVEKMISRC